MTVQMGTGAMIGAGGDASYRQPRSLSVFDVCPHCKRVLMATGPTNGQCGEHGDVVPMRSAVTNAGDNGRPLAASVERGRLRNGLD